MRYYVVWKGRKPGIYDSWALAKEHTHRFRGAKFKGFDTYLEAEKAFNSNPEEFLRTYQNNPERSISDSEELRNSILIDIQSGSDDKDSLSAISMGDGEVFFQIWIPSVSSKRLGYFLGALKALEYCSLMEDSRKILVPSKTVYHWLTVKKRCSSKFLYLLDGDMINQMDILINDLRSGSLPHDQIFFCAPELLNEKVCVG